MAITKIGKTLQHHLLFEQTLQGSLALLVGLGSSLLVLLFKQLVDWLTEGMRWAGAHWLGGLIPWWVALLPVVGGLAVGLMQRYILQRERHHGVAGIMEAVALGGGRLPYLQAPAKVLAAIISLSSGASVGPEDPSVQIGANLGSFLGQKLHLSERRTVLLVATGAAAGIATAFNAPIAGVFFAVELILGEYSAASFGMLLLGSVTAVVVTRALVGPMPAFPIPAYAYGGPIELPFYFALGLLAAPVALAYIRMLYYAHDWFHHSPLPVWARPALLGAVLGAVALRYPQILGDGYETVGKILWGQELIPGLLVVLLILKLLFTDFSLGAGFVGGVFAPSLFLGAALGGAFGGLMAHLFPSVGIQPTAFALVGMAGVLAGAVRAPGTALMLLFEMTNDYRIFLPLMLVIAISMGISSWLEQDSVYTLSLRRAGIRLRKGRDVDVLETILVQDVMTEPPDPIRSETPLRVAAALLGRSHTNGVPVVDDNGRLLGVISLQDVERALNESPDNLHQPVRGFCSRRLLVAYPDETVHDALERMAMHDIGRLPVVSRGDARRLVGWLSRRAVIHAYKLALVERMKQQHRGEQVRLGAFSGAEVLELMVMPHSPLVGKRMREVSWPENSLVASIRRGTHLIIPHGDTVIQEGDRLAVVVEPEDKEQLYRLVDGENKSREK